MLLFNTNQTDIETGLSGQWLDATVRVYSYEYMVIVVKARYTYRLSKGPMVFNLLFYTPFSCLLLFFNKFQISPRKYLLEMNSINTNNLSIILFALHV
jgi:hypothetical protein